MTDPRIEAAARELKRLFSDDESTTDDTWIACAKCVLEAADQAAWRTIESAPKGKKILVREEGNWTGIAIFHTEGKFSGQWIYINAVDPHENLLPTHWQPLPKPPTS